MLSTVAFLLAAGLAYAQTPSATPNPCKAYGIDFQTGGTYFQNISSSDPFTFTTQFEGCQPDICHNALVDPNGDEVQCSNTTLTPSGENMVSTCPTLKDQLQSGEYSVMLLSNNGNGAPIAYERDFNIIAGTPVTSTITPTVWATITTSAVQNTTMTSTLLLTTHWNTTVTEAATTVTPTATSRPRTIVTVTETVGTIYEVSHTVEPVFVTETATATCSFSPRQPNPDPWCTRLPTILPIPDGLQIQPNSAKFKFPRGTYDRIVPVDKEQRIRERKARLAQRAAMGKRALDSSIVTETLMNTALYFTSTSTITNTTSVMTITTQATATTTETDTFTTVAGATTLPTETITLPTRTHTRVRYTVVTDVISTKTNTPTLSVTTTITPPGALPECTQQGGWMWIY